MSLFGGKRSSSPAAPRGKQEESPSDARDSRTGDSIPTSEGSPKETRKTGGAQPSGGGKQVANIGKSIIIKGDLTGDEDLEIEGQVDGRIQLAQNQVTIGANGIIKAEIDAKSIVIVGKVTGNLRASERLEIQSTGVVNGDIRAPRMLIQEGAKVNGNIEMTEKTAEAHLDKSDKARKSTSPQPVTSAAPAT